MSDAPEAVMTGTNSIGGKRSGTVSTPAPETGAAAVQDPDVRIPIRGSAILLGLIVFWAFGVPLTGAILSRMSFDDIRSMVTSPIPAAGPAIPERGIWAVLSQAQREAVARSFGYDGPVRDGLFARYLDDHPALRADFSARFPLPASAISERGTWAVLSQVQREAVARSFGYDGPVRDGLFARYLDDHPALRADFSARFALPPPAIPERGTWAVLSQAQREAVARSFGYDGPVRDGLFARYLDDHPALRADFSARFPLPPPADASVVAAEPARPPAPESAKAAPPVPGPPVSARIERKPTPSSSATAKATPLPQAPAADGARNFVIQVGSFQAAANAEALVHRLSSRGYSPQVFDWTDPQHRRWHVVRVGNFKSMSEAMRSAKELNGLGIPAQILSLHP